MTQQPDTVKTGTVTGPTPFAKFVEYCQNRADIEGEIVRKELAEGQMTNILDAGSEDELFAAMEMAGLMGLRELDDGAEIQINGFHLVRGSRDEFANSLGVFAVMDAQYVKDGTPAALDTGIERIIGFLRMVESEAAGVKFPVQVRVKKQAAGRGDLITFQKLPERAIKGKTQDK